MLKEYTIVIGDENLNIEDVHDTIRTFYDLGGNEAPPDAGYNLIAGAGWSKKWGEEFTARISVWHDPDTWWIGYGPGVLAHYLRIMFGQDAVALIHPGGEVRFAEGMK